MLHKHCALRIPCIGWALLCALNAPAPAQDDSIKVLLDPTLVDVRERLILAGASLVADRGTYSVYEVSSDGLPIEEVTGLTPRRDFDVLSLRRGVVDTRSRRTGSVAMPSTVTAETRLKLVQLAAPPDDQDIETLLAAGARIVQYVPQHAYLVWTEDARSAAGLGTIAPGGHPLQFLADYAAEYAVSPALDRATGSSQSLDVAIQLFNAGEQAIQDINSIERLALRILTPAALAVHERYVNLRVSVHGTDISVIAALPTVVNVEPYVPPQLLGERQGQILAGNLNASEAAPASSGYLTWLGSLGFSTDSSDYPIVAIVDDGVDNGPTAPLTSEFYEINDPLAASRLAFAVTPPGAANGNPYGPTGHGHLNASIVAGYNNDIGPAVHDVFGFHYGLGIAPYGRVGNVRAFTPTFDTGTGTGTMVADYHSRGARISSNSWGSPTTGIYDLSAQEYDALTRDARTNIAGNQQLLFVFAAGNDGPVAGSMGSPATAKNVLSVGASETFDLDADEGTGCGDTLADGNDARDVADFSSRGPCVDGRIKPDVVAPGTFIHGAASQPTFTGAGVCGATTNDFAAPGLDALFPPGSAYTWSSGTSLAAPGISGYAALVAEHLARVHGILDPSPALLKAFVVHSTRHLTGAFADDNLPSPSQGFGIADMSRGFDLDTTRFIQDQPTLFTSSGDSFTFTGSILDGNEPVRIALAWTDAPGSTFGSAFVNDLNLSVDIDGIVYNGNNFVGGVSQPGGTPDFRNNVEAVFLPPGSSGPAMITIEALSIGGDGVPGNADITDQDFALVAYNFTDVTSAGVVKLDRQIYNCSDTIIMTLRDIDLRGAGSTTVGLTTAGGDLETILLLEEPAESGIFTASIPTDSAAVSMGSDTVETADGDLMTLSYSDEDDGTGNPVVVQDMAGVDCIPPTASSISVTALGGTFATIDLETSENSSLIISYGTHCDSLTDTLPGIGAATSHSVTLTGLMPLADYFFVIEIVDAAGNITNDDAGGSCFSFSTLEPSDYFTEVLNPLDLAGTTLTLTPDDSNNFYRACRSPAFTFPTSVSGATSLVLDDDDSQRIDVGGGSLARLYGVPYGSFYVNSNGNLTFGVADSDFAPTLADHFDVPRIAALFDDLDPSSGGAVWWKQLHDRVAVTYQDVPEFGGSAGNNFQVEMFFDGRIRMTHLTIASNDALVGVSAGLGVPVDFVESDLAAYGQCLESAGTVLLNAPIYNCVDAVTVTVEDTDLVSAGSADVLLTSSGGDSETLPLAETPIGSGTFVGTAPTSSDATVAEDGVLQLSSGQTVTATYEDSDDGTGAPAIRSFTSRTLCTDHFVIYRHRVSRNGVRFHRFGPLTLSDELGSASYNIARPVSLGVPADKNAEGINDAATHIEEYIIKPVRGTPRFERASEIRAITQCGDLYLQAVRPMSILVPSNTDTTSPAPPLLEAAHELDHFLCYRAKVMKRLSDGSRVDGLARGTQVDVTDAFQTRRYDLKRVTRFCTPLDKSGAPIVLSGPDKGASKAIEPATIRNPDDRLVCYKATLAKTIIPQDGCGPLDMASSAKIEPPQEKHTKRTNVHVNNQFGAGQRDTVRELELCIPSLRTP